MGADFSDSKIAGPSINVWLNDPNRKTKSEGCRNARAAKNHAIPGIGIEGVNMHAVKLGCDVGNLRSRHRNAASNRRLQVTNNCTPKTFLPYSNSIMESSPKGKALRAKLTIRRATRQASKIPSCMMRNKFAAYSAS
jgi:hypothetical protein